MAARGQIDDPVMRDRIIRAIMAQMQQQQPGDPAPVLDQPPMPPPPAPMPYYSSRYRPPPPRIDDGTGIDPGIDLGGPGPDIGPDIGPPGGGGGQPGGGGRDDVPPPDQPPPDQNVWDIPAIDVSQSGGRGDLPIGTEPTQDFYGTFGPGGPNAGGNYTGGYGPAGNTSVYGGIGGVGYGPGFGVENISQADPIGWGQLGSGRGNPDYDPMQAYNAASPEQMAAAMAASEQQAQAPAFDPFDPAGYDFTTASDPNTFDPGSFAGDPQWDFDPEFDAYDEEPDGYDEGYDDEADDDGDDDGDDE